MTIFSCPVHCRFPSWVASWICVFPLEFMTLAVAEATQANTFTIFDWSLWIANLIANWRSEHTWQLALVWSMLIVNTKFRQNQTIADTINTIMILRDTGNNIVEFNHFGISTVNKFKHRRLFQAVAILDISRKNMFQVRLDEFVWFCLSMLEN